MKTYSLKRKIISVLLLAVAFLMLMAAWTLSSEVKSMTAYDSYYDWEITEASAEKQEDGKYLITADIKNNSAYRAKIDNYDISIQYGNENRVEIEAPECPEGKLFDTLRECIVPAGQSIKYEMLIAPPQGTKTVRLNYYGTSYKKDQILGEDRDYTSYTVNLP